MIVTHKKVIRYEIEHELHYVNKYGNKPTSLQMARISLIDERLDEQNNNRNIILFDDYTLENCLISTYLLWFSTRFQMEKNCGDTPSARLIITGLCIWFLKWSLRLPEPTVISVDRFGIIWILSPNPFCWIIFEAHLAMGSNAYKNSTSCEVKCLLYHRSFAKSYMTLLSLQSFF